MKTLKLLINFTFATLLLSDTCNAISNFNAPTTFERRYNANSFILNTITRHKRYATIKQSLGKRALRKIDRQDKRKTARKNAVA